MDLVFVGFAVLARGFILRCDELPVSVGYAGAAGVASLLLNEGFDVPRRVGEKSLPSRDVLWSYSRHRI